MTEDKKAPREAGPKLSVHLSLNDEGNLVVRVYCLRDGVLHLIADFLNTSDDDLLTDCSFLQGLNINDEGIDRVVFGLALECHEWCLARGIPSESAEAHRLHALAVILKHRTDVLEVRLCPTGGAAKFGIVTGFSEAGYRLAAKTAKDWLVLPIDRYRDALRQVGFSFSDVPSA